MPIPIVSIDFSAIATDILNPSEYFSATGEKHPLSNKGERDSEILYTDTGVEVDTSEYFSATGEKHPLTKYRKRRPKVNVEKEVLETEILPLPEPPSIPRIDIEKHINYAFANLEGVRKRIEDSYEEYSYDFVRNEPELLFVSEYVVDHERLGVLVAWKKYKNATHYELFKKNVFQSSPRLERILYLGVEDLTKETKNYDWYVKNVLQLNVNIDEIIIIFDHKIKEDRVYEYAVKAVEIPQEGSKIDYDMIMECKGQINNHELTSQQTVFGVSKSILGRQELAWVLSLLNVSVPFFGIDAKRKSFTTWVDTIGKKEQEARLEMERQESSQDIGHNSHSGKNHGKPPTSVVDSENANSVRVLLRGLGG